MSVYPFSHRAFSNAQHCDGIIFKHSFSDVNNGLRFQSDLHQRMQAIVPMDREDDKRCFKEQTFFMDKQRVSNVRKVEMFGEYSRNFWQLGWEYSRYAHGMHVKGYIVPMYPGAMLDFRKDMFDNEDFGRQLTMFGPGKNKAKTKGDGKGWRLSDRNSDYHFVAYTREGQLLGLELRVQDAAFRRLQSKCQEIYGALKLPDNVMWTQLQQMVVKKAWEEFDKDCRDKSVKLDKYVRGFTDWPSSSGPRVQFWQLGTNELLELDYESGEVKSIDIRF